MSVNTAGAGKRIIIAHDITEDGPLVAKEDCDQDTGTPKPGEWLNARGSTAYPCPGDGAGVGGRGARRKRLSTGWGDDDSGDGGGEGGRHSSTDGEAVSTWRPKNRDTAGARANTEME